MPSLPSPAAHFGKYEILGRLAVGGMADIFLAREVNPAGGTRHVVLKLLRAVLTDESEFEAMFLREGRVAMQLQHPNVCHVYEFGKWGGHFYIAMQWIEGVHMRELLLRHAALGETVPVPVTAWIVAQVAGALDYAHRARDARRRPLNVIHRDVTPHNIMVGYDGNVKLLDFGVAKAREDGEVTISQSAAVKGKFAYMSPEQCVGEPLDGRSDVFALGICLYEALTMRRLYKRETQYNTFEAILKDAAPSIRDTDPDLPEELDAIVKKALAKKPADRYSNAGEMEHDLRKFLAGRGKVMSAATVRTMMRDAFEDEYRAGPKLERSDEALTRLAATQDHIPLSSQPPPADLAESVPTAPAVPNERRMRNLLLAGLAAVVAIVAGGAFLSSGGEDAAPEPEPEVVVEDPGVEDPVTETPAVEATEDLETDLAEDPLAEDPLEDPEVEDPVEEDPEAERERRRDRSRSRMRRAKMRAPMFLTDPGY